MKRRDSGRRPFLWAYAVKTFFILVCFFTLKMVSRPPCFRDGQWQRAAKSGDGTNTATSANYTWSLTFNVITCCAGLTSAFLFSSSDIVKRRCEKWWVGELGFARNQGQIVRKTMSLRQIVFGHRVSVQGTSAM